MSKLKGIKSYNGKHKIDFPRPIEYEHEKDRNIAQTLVYIIQQICEEWKKDVKRK